MENINTTESNTETAHAEIQPAKPEAISTEAELARVASEKAKHEERLDAVAVARASTASRLAAAREKMGLPPLDETPPSLAAYDSEAEKIKNAQEALRERERSLISEQEKKMLVRQEELNMIHERVEELRELFDEPARATIVETGRIPSGARVPSWLVAPSQEEIQQWFAIASRKEELTVENLDEDPLLEKPKEAVRAEAEKTVAEALAKAESGEANQPAGFAEVAPETDRVPLIGYEGETYTPESLVARVEEQNREAEIKDTTAHAAQSYDSSVQSN